MVVVAYRATDSTRASSSQNRQNRRTAATQPATSRAKERRAGASNAPTARPRCGAGRGGTAAGVGSPCGGDCRTAASTGSMEMTRPFGTNGLPRPVAAKLSGAAGGRCCLRAGSAYAGCLFRWLHRAVAPSAGRWAGPLRRRSFLTALGTPDDGGGCHQEWHPYMLLLDSYGAHYQRKLLKE